MLIQLLRLATVQAQDADKEQHSAQTDGYAMVKEIKDLKREIKALQKSVQQFKQESAGSIPKQAKESQISVNSVQSVISCCRDSWNRREQIAEHILDYQTKLMGEVKKIKKNRVVSSSKGKSSHSAIPLTGDCGGFENNGFTGC